MSASTDKLNVFPAFIKVAEKRVLVVGGGEEAFAKVRLLANTNARIVIAADTMAADLERYASANGLECIIEEFRDTHLADVVLVFAATGDAAADRAVVDAARAAGIPANAVDQPDYCDFYTPALVNRAPVAVAIGTEGAGPVLGQMIRAQVDRMLPPYLGALARLAASYRLAVDKLLPRGVARRVFWRRFFEDAPADAVARGDISGARRAASRMLRDIGNVGGHVWLIGAGPGASDLLTLRAQRAMMEADVIVHDALVPQEIVDLGRRDAERIAVGKRKGCHSKSQKEINRLLVDLATSGKRVARVKSGDPLVFGRAGEEMAALRDASVGYEIVPGITSAFAAAADFELPLTLRGIASSLVFTTGHDLNSDTLPDWAGLALSGATVAVYMGRTVAARVAGRLMEAGMARETTIAVVENASRANRRKFHGTLAHLPNLESRDDLSGPVMVIIGDAVAGANFNRSTLLTAKAPQALEAA